VEIYTGTFVKRIGLKLADRLTAAGVDKKHHSVHRWMGDKGAVR